MMQKRNPAGNATEAAVVTMRTKERADNAAATKRTRVPGVFSNKKSIVALLLFLSALALWTDKQIFKLESVSKVLLLEDAEHLKLSPISGRKFDLPPTTDACKRLSPFGMGNAPIRIFIYQKKGGQQLVNILIHYLQALTYDEIVIIANEDDDGGDLLESNAFYQNIVSKGIHFWQCAGSLQEKGKNWQQVINQYQDKTEFLLPIDVDEYLAIALPEEDTTKPTLVFDRISLLVNLKKLPSSGGKWYKTLDAKPLPVDCEDHPDGIIPDFQKRYSPHHCNIPGITKGKMGCFNKNIIAGKDFTTLDNGNHHGPKEKTVEWRTNCETNGVESTYIPSNFVLIHYQVLDFSDWLIHMLKRVVDYKYEMDCDKPESNWPLFHVCNAHKTAKAANFSVHEMTKIYDSWFCVMRSYYDTTGITTLSC
mmetsp:Transcript_15407/g.17611  ORF Transcript_15407/g.17611 Transcript_15407/m.17611 type:complete len:422 (+) Transcript_15407:119-1384(+)